MKTNAIYFTGPRQAEMREEELGPPGPGEVQVASIVSHVSLGTETHCYRGEFEAGTIWERWVTYPFRPGYSTVGRVTALGDGVDDLAVGDRVTTTSPHRSHFNMARNPAGMIRLQESDSADAAAWSALAVTTQTGVRRVAHAMGDRAVVIGLGPLGQLVTQYLRLLGLARIMVIDMDQHRLDLAKAHGATDCFCGRADAAATWVAERTDGDLADVVYDITGHAAVFASALTLVRQHGILLLMGDTPYPHQQHLTPDVLGRQITIMGTHSHQVPPAMAAWTRARQIRLFLDYVARGDMRVTDLTDRRISPAELPALYDSLVAAPSPWLGVLVDWTSPTCPTRPPESPCAS